MDDYDDIGHHDDMPYDDDIPPLRRPEDMPPVLCQADLHRHWRVLMGELAFGEERIFAQLFRCDGAPLPLVLDLVELPDLPEKQAADMLLSFFSEALESIGEPGARLALLYARPGSPVRTRRDLAWGEALTDAARRHGVPMHPVHLANDEELTVVSPDDLVRPA